MTRRRSTWTVDVASERRAARWDATDLPNPSSLQKRPLSAYMLFSQDKRAEVKEEKPDVTFGQSGTFDIVPHVCPGTDPYPSPAQARSARSSVPSGRRPTRLSARCARFDASAIFYSKALTRRCSPSQPYEDKAAAEKARYEKEKAAYDVRACVPFVH